MTYEDAGFNQYLLRPLEATYTEQTGIDSNAAYEQISGSQIRGDKIVSLSNSLGLDLENELFFVNDGRTNRIELGKLPDGSIGMIIRDDLGNILLEISESVNILRSSDGNLEYDFDNKRILLKQNGLPRLVIGEV